jgi:hypothetical protein
MTFRLLPGTNGVSDFSETDQTSRWALRLENPTWHPLFAADLARQTLGSFATVWQVKHDWQVLVEAKLGT